MNCFNHRDRSAIGICRSCGKGLCEDCVAEVQNGLACKGSCEARVKLINRTIGVYPQIMRAGRRRSWVVALLFAVLGLASVVGSAFEYAEADDPSLPWFLGVMGSVLLVLAILGLWQASRYPRLDK
jgi:hypothetical protein